MTLLGQLQLLWFNCWGGGNFGWSNRHGRSRYFASSALLRSGRSERSVSLFCMRVKGLTHSGGSARRRFNFLLAGRLTRGALPSAAIALARTFSRTMCERARVYCLLTRNRDLCHTCCADSESDCRSKGDRSVDRKRPRSARCRGPGA